ncbi:outer membrane protein [Rhizobium sp. PAMB 3182]
MKLITVSSMIVMVATSVFAADVVSPDSQLPIAPDKVQPYNWSGGYLGVQGGYGWMNGTFKTTGLVPLDGNFDGGLLGGFAGFNYQFGNNVVAGVEADFERNWNDKTLISGLGTVNGGTTWQGSVRARVGYAFDRALIYASGGWAASRADAEVVGLGSDKKTFNGFTVGAGVDYAITDNIFARVDYRYNDFGKKDFNFGGSTVEGELKQHTLKVGVGYKF